MRCWLELESMGHMCWSVTHMEAGLTEASTMNAAIIGPYEISPHLSG
jgi:hypothetical protein